MPAFKKNPELDYLFGIFGGEKIPTKQDKYKPLGTLVETDDEGYEYLSNILYEGKPDTESVSKFKATIEQEFRKYFPDENIIKAPQHVEVTLSFSLHRRRMREVDLDNLTKTVLDSLVGLVFEDDSQVTQLIVDKHWHPMDINGLLISVTKITETRKGLMGQIKGMNRF